VATLGAHVFAGISTTLTFVWDSLYGLIFGFLISAIAQVAFSRGAMQRALGPNLGGIVRGTLFGIVASACSYGAAAAARGFYQKGADARSVFAFTIASTNMNIAIVIMFWAMLGWQFAFAEFFGGLIVIAIVVAGFTLLLRPGDLRVAESAVAGRGARVDECLQCGMEGDAGNAVVYEGTEYLFCGARHEAQFRAEPAAVLAAANADGEAALGLVALRKRTTWRSVLETMRADVEMLRGELLIGFVVAGFAAALVPAHLLAQALRSVGAIPYAGYPLLLVAGLLLAVVTFVCSMGNVPIARFLAGAGIPLGANTTFIYGDLLIPPLVGIYRKSFPRKVVWTFLGLFTFGALVAGAVMDFALGRTFGGAMAMGSLGASDRFTLVANICAVVALVAVALGARNWTSPSTQSAPTG
jgi:uncharacterized membrane protein YraQ (UPF0718 family)